MPTKPEGVYADGRGGWYLKVTVGRDGLSGRRTQITKRGFATAAAAGRARRELLSQVDKNLLKPTPAGTTINELLDFYLDGLDADGRLSAKTRYDYRRSAKDYIRPHLGTKKVKDVTPQIIVAWQRLLLNRGGTKAGRPLAANTVRLARAPLAGAFKLALSTGMVALNPIAGAARPRPQRRLPRHWTPEQAREFLSLMEGDRTWPVWAFLLGSGLRIGELVCLRWSSVDLANGLVRVVDFVSTLDHEVVPSTGKSRDAVRTIDLDDGLVDVLRRQRKLQAEERLAAADWVESDCVFTKPGGGSYHPQYLSKLLGTYSAELGLPRLTAHGLRHTSATLMLASGVPAKVAAERLGHADPTLFTNLYSHVTPTMQRDAAARIGAALFGPAPAGGRSSPGG
ncbi:MAG: tyrosine-type recombinase/integrase [Acidimicrobiales bacterium]